MKTNLDFNPSQASLLFDDPKWFEDLRVQALHSYERAPWLGGDLQTVAHRLIHRNRLIPGVKTLMQFPLRDQSGDIMTGTLHDPGKGGPLVMLLHGLAGSEDSVYIRSTAHHLAQQGMRVLRLNHRGAGSSLGSCSIPYQCAGTAEIIEILDSLSDELTESGIFLCGFSMGGAILLNMLSEIGRDLRICGAMTVSAPLDLTSASAQLNRHRNVIYQKVLLATLMRFERTLRNSCKLVDDEPLHNPRSLFEYDELFTAPRHGFTSAVDYYHKTSPLPRLKNIRVPVVMLHAENDPWISSDSYRLTAKNCHTNIRILLTEYGGHVGFHFRQRANPFYFDVLNQMLSAN